MGKMEATASVTTTNISAKKKKKNNKKIIGSTVTTLVLLLGGILLGLFFWKMSEDRKKIKEGEKIEIKEKELEKKEIKEVPEKKEIKEVPEKKEIREDEFEKKEQRYQDVEAGISDEDFFKTLPPDFLSKYEEKKKELSDESMYNPFKVQVFLNLYRNHLYFLYSHGKSGDTKLQPNVDALENLLELIPETLKVREDRQLQKEDFFEKIDPKDVTKRSYISPSNYSSIVMETYELLLKQSDFFFGIDVVTEEEAKKFLQMAEEKKSTFKSKILDIADNLNDENIQRQKKQHSEQRMKLEEKIMIAPHFRLNQIRIESDIAAVRHLPSYYEDNMSQLQRAISLKFTTAPKEEHVSDMESKQKIEQLENSKFLHPHIAKALLLFGKATYTFKSS